MRECGCFSTTTLAQLRRPCRPRHPYAVPRTLSQCVCTRRRNCIGQLSPSPEYVPAARQINPNTSAIVLRLVALCVWRVDPAPSDPVLLAAKAGAAGGGCALMCTLGRYSRRNSNGRGWDSLRRYSNISLQAYYTHHPAQPCCRAIKTRATKRSIAFLAAEARPFDTMEFSRCWARFR